MAEGYPLPPWLHGVSAGEVGQLAAGAQSRILQGSEAQARLNMQAQEESQRFAMESARLEQERQSRQLQLELASRGLQEESQRRYAQIEMQRQYHDQAINVAQDRLKLQSQAAARKYSAQANLQADLAAAGDDEAAKRAAVLKWGPEIGGMATAVSGALRAGANARQYGPITMSDLGGGVRAAYREGSPGLHIIPPAKSREPTPGQLAQLAREIPHLEAISKAVPGGMSERLLKLLGPMIEGAPTSGTSTSQYPIAPRDAKRRVVNQIYQTPKGPYLWGKDKDGKIGWMLPPETETGQTPAATETEEEPDTDEMGLDIPGD